MIESQFKKKFKSTKSEYHVNLYDKVLELRKFEIENFWKRTLFFWGTIAIIYAGYFKSDANNYQVILPLMGLLFNIVFSLSIRGSKYWQEHWESMAVVFENELDFELFKKGAHDIIGNNNNSIFTKPYRFSVSKLTMLLSDLSVILWFFLWLKELAGLFESNILKFEFSFHSQIHWFTLGILVIHFSLVGYFVIFLRNGKIFYPFKKQNKEQ